VALGSLQTSLQLRADES